LTVTPRKPSLYDRANGIEKNPPVPFHDDALRIVDGYLFKRAFGPQVYSRISDIEEMDRVFTDLPDGQRKRGHHAAADPPTNLTALLAFPAAVSILSQMLPLVSAKTETIVSRAVFDASQSHGRVLMPSATAKIIRPSSFDSCTTKASPHFSFPAFVADCDLLTISVGLFHLQKILERPLMNINRAKVVPSFFGII
jgi:hypothetical protein